MKRHSTTGPDAIYPAFGKDMILWLQGRDRWTRGYLSNGDWFTPTGQCITPNVIAWSDPTEADAGGMVPVAWVNQWEVTCYGAERPTVHGCEWTPLYATPPDTAPVWRPIETAPKTSKAQLVWVPENKCIFCVSWADPTGWHIFGGGWREHLQRATHWMPLPADPGESAPTIDHTAVMRQAVEALTDMVRVTDDPVGLTSAILDDGPAFEAFMNACQADLKTSVAKARAALAALRGALPQPKESHD